MLPRYQTLLTALFLVLLGLILFWTLTSELAAQAPPSAAAQEEIRTAAVTIDGDELFRVRGTSSFPAEARAGLIAERIVGIARDQRIPVDALAAAPMDDGIRIAAREHLIMQLLPADASLEQVAPADLAIAHLARLRHAVIAYREARSARALRRNARDVSLASLALAAAIAALISVWRRVDAFLVRRLQRRIHTVGIQSFELLTAERIWSGVRGVLQGIRTIALLGLVLLYLGFVLAQFPWTRPLAGDLTAFIRRPLEVIGRGVVSNIPSVVFLVVLFFLVRLVIRLTRLFFDAVGRGSVRLAAFDAEWAQPTYKIVRVAIVAFGLIVAYPYIPGSESAAFKGVSLFVGLVFSLGSSTAIANIVAGYMMTYRRAFKVGDIIRLGSAAGQVVETRLQVTRLRTPKNEELVIPNSQILTGEVLNYSALARVDGLILHTEVGIGYDTPWRQVEALLMMAAERTPGLLVDPPPFVLERKLGDFAVTYELNAYCRDVSRMFRLYAELHRQILDVFNEYGVQIMTPAYEGDPDVPKVVARKDWQRAPARNRPSAGLA